MTKAFLYHPFGGYVVRCVCAGLDNDGQPRWVNITPGEQASALTQIDECDRKVSKPMMILSVEDETASSVIIAKVLAEVMMHPKGSYRTACADAVRRMKKIGLKWDDRPIGINVTVVKEKGKYSYLIKEDYSSGEKLQTIDGVYCPEEVYSFLNWYFMALEISAEIPIKEKTLSINSKLKKEVGRRFLSLFDRVEKTDS